MQGLLLQGLPIDGIILVSMRLYGKIAHRWLQNESDAMSVSCNQLNHERSSTSGPNYQVGPFRKQKKYK